MFLECPLKYKFYYIDELREYCKPKPYQSMGISVHSALYAFFKQEERAIDVLHNLLRKHWIREGFKDREEERMWGLKALSMLKNFFDTSNVYAKPIMLEEEFIVPFDSFILTGRIDRVDRRSDGSYEVIDYKTGEPMDKDKADSDLQMTIYAIALVHGRKIEPDYLTFYFLKDSTKMTTKRTELHIEEGIMFIKETVERIKNEKEYLPKPNRFCGYCDFTILCPFFMDDKVL